MNSVVWHEMKKASAGMALALIFLAVGYQEDTRSYSCHLCRNTKTQKSTRCWLVPLTSSEIVRHNYTFKVGHTHNWYRYSRFRSMGYGGWLGSSVGCTPHKYRDGQKPGQ